MIFQCKLFRPEGNGRMFVQWWKRKTYNQDYSNQQGSHSDMKKKWKALQTKAERIQHHPTSSSTNAKGSSLNRKHRKGLKTRIQYNKVNCNGIIIINNYLKCKWVECPNQKKKTGWMDKKTRLLYMLSSRDPPQTKGHIQTENERLEKYISCKWRPKESRNRNTHIR